MNAYWLHMPDGTRTEYSACGVCGKLARYESNFDISEKCCTCYDCGKPLAPEERQYANSLYHRACDQKRRSAREAALMEKAQLVTDYDGPVYLDGYGSGSYGDGYFADVDELAEHLDSRLSEGEDRPQFAYCCESSPVARLNLADILESMCEEAFEDAIDHLHGVDELQAAMDAFIKANEAVLTWSPDHKRKVAIPAPVDAAKAKRGSL